MKHLFTIIFSFFIVLLNAQTFHKCATSELISQGEQYNPGYSQSIKDEFQRIKTKNLKRSNTIYRIPVVFHIVWNTATPEENIPDSCIHRQIELLNIAFRAKNADKSNLRPIFGLEAKDAEIEFYLATKDPQGRSTNGITRTPTNIKFITELFSSKINIDMKSSSTGGQDPWDVTKYYNVWVVNMPLNFIDEEKIGILGFSTPPSGLPNWASSALEGIGADGTVVQYQFISNNNPNFERLDSAYKVADSGKTLIHETGHYLGLRHIWADKVDSLTGEPACVNVDGIIEDDGIDDTPYCASSSEMSSCKDDNKNTCIHESPDLPDMWENYMDYSPEKCLVAFTPDQSDFMRKVIEQKRLKLVSWDVQTKNEDHLAEKYEIYYQSESVRISSTYKMADQVQIINNSGQVVLNQKLNPNQSEYYISCKNLPHGVYTVLLQSDHSNCIKKFVKI